MQNKIKEDDSKSLKSIMMGLKRKSKRTYDYLKKETLETLMYQ